MFTTSRVQKAASAVRQAMQAQERPTISTPPMPASRGLIFITLLVHTGHSTTTKLLCQQ